MANEVFRKVYIKGELDWYRNATLVLCINKKHENGKDIFYLLTKRFQLKWFTDCGNWFLYIHVGKRWIRFSNCGFVKGMDC